MTPTISFHAEDGPLATGERMSLLDGLRRDIEEAGFEVPTASEASAVVGALLRRLERAALHPDLCSPPEEAPDDSAVVQAQPTGAPPLVNTVAPVAPAPPVAPAVPVVEPPTTDDADSDETAWLRDELARTKAQLADVLAAHVPGPPVVTVTDELPDLTGTPAAVEVPAAVEAPENTGPTPPAPATHNGGG